MSFFALIFAELKSLLKNPAITLTVIGGAIFYTFLYPQPYLKQVITEQKITLIDQDNTNFSKKLAFKIDATPEIEIFNQANSLKEAKANILNDTTTGVLLIPKDFYKDIKLKKSPVLVYGADASYFLIFGTVAEGIVHVIENMSNDININTIALDGGVWQDLKENPTPLTLNANPVFNPTMGYINYVLPAVFILIFQQIMIIGAGLQGSTFNELKQGYWTKITPLKLLLGRIIAFFIVYVLIGMYYLGLFLDMYSVPHFAKMSEIWLLLIPFILSCICLGIVIGELIPRRELVTFSVLVSSLPLVFTAGFVWPTFATPIWLKWLVSWAPCTHGIMEFLQLNQMGADFSQILLHWTFVLCLGILYFLLSWLLLRRKYAKS